MLRHLRRLKAPGAPAGGEGETESIRSTRKVDDAVSPAITTTTTLSPLQTIKKSSSTSSPAPEQKQESTTLQSNRLTSKPKSKKKTRSNLSTDSTSQAVAAAAAAGSSSSAVEDNRGPTSKHTRGGGGGGGGAEPSSHASSSSSHLPITTPTSRNQKKTPIPDNALRPGWNIMVPDDTGLQKDKERKAKKKIKKKSTMSSSTSHNNHNNHHNKESASGKEQQQQQQQISMSTHHHQPEHVKHHPLVSPAQTKKPTVVSSSNNNNKQSRGTTNIFMGVRQGSLRNLFKRDSSKRSVTSNRSKESESEAGDSSSNRSFRSFALDESSSHSKKQVAHHQQQQPPQPQSDNLRQGTTSAGAYANIWLKDINAHKTSSAASDDTDEDDDNGDGGDDDDDIYNRDIVLKSPKGRGGADDDDDDEDYNDNPYQEELEELASSSTNNNNKSKKRRSINSDKRKALLVSSRRKEDVGHSTASIYIEDDSGPLEDHGEADDGRDKKNLFALHGSHNSNNNNSNNNGNSNNSSSSIIPPRDEETWTELTRLRKENVKLSHKLEYAESEVEKLKKERRSEKSKIKDVTNRLDQLVKDHGKAMDELARQEHAILEKDMLIMTLEEKMDGGGRRRSHNNSNNNKAVRVSAVVIPDGVQLQEYQDMQDDCSELSGEDYGMKESDSKQQQQQPLRISTIRNARAAEKEKDELAAKDLEILELKLQVKQLKEEQNEDHPNRKPVDDLVKENKALRKEILAWRDKERDHGMILRGDTVAAEKVKNLRGLSASLVVPSDVVQSEETNKNKNNETLSYDADEMLDEFEIQELHQQLQEQGIPPTLHVSLENSFENRTSTISMGDHSYLYDLENQLANKEHEQEQELLEEARELYQVALEEKGISGSRELLLFIYTELLEDTQEKRQDERKRLELKFKEEKKKAALALAKEKKEGDNLEKFDGELHPDQIDPEMINILTDIRDDIGKRKSFNYSAMVKEINMANVAGDSLKKELEYAQARLQEKEKEIEELKAKAADGSHRPTNQRMSLSANMQEELLAVRAEKDTITQQLKDELLEVLEKLDEKDEAIANLQKQIIQSNQKSDQYEKIKEQEKEIHKYKQLAEDRSKDVAVIRLEIEELREEMGLRPSDKSYFSKSKSAEEDGSVAGMRLSESLSQIFKWGDKGMKESPRPTPALEPRKGEEDDEDENGPSKIMGSFVKNYLAKKAPP
jgi:hypothetical protein